MVDTSLYVIQTVLKKKSKNDRHLVKYEEKMRKSVGETVQE